MSWPLTAESSWQAACLVFWSGPGAALQLMLHSTRS